MSIVAVNSQYVVIPGFSNPSLFKVGHTGEFIIKSTEQSLPISAGDDLIFIKPSKGDLIFSNSGRISKIGRKDIIKGKPVAKGATFSYQNKDAYNHYFDFEVKAILNKNNKLSELEYSLPVVENYHKPEVHFQSQYRTLPKNDFDTIVNGWVYATRTVFGKLVNALPRQNKLEFMIEAMDHFSTIDFKDTSLIDGLDFLYRYIEHRILSRGKLLVATDGIIKNELKDLLPPNDVGFIDPETNSIQNISNQADIFKNLFKLEKEKSLKSSLEDTLKKNRELEARFQKLFIRRAWPVDLEK